MISGVYTIAVVDDDRRVCETLKAMIEGASPEYRVLCAHDGKKGLSMITRQEPDVAILDVGMPRMDGLAVLEKLKQGHRAPRVGVIMLTGNDSKQNAETSTYWYADAYLTKPCSAETLMAAIHRSLSCRATARNSNQSI